MTIIFIIDIRPSATAGSSLINSKTHNVASYICSFGLSSEFIKELIISAHSAIVLLPSVFLSGNEKLASLRTSARINFKEK